MLRPCLLCFLIAAYAPTHNGVVATTIDDNSIGLIIVVTGKCVEGVILNYRNGSSVVYGQGHIAGKSTHALLQKGETLSGVEWVSGRNNCCSDQLGTSFSFTTSAGRIIVAQAEVGACALGDVSRFQVQRPSEHIVGLSFANQSLVGVQSGSVCHGGNLCFMQGLQCLQQGRQFCMTPEGLQRESGFVTSVIHEGSPLCCQNCVQGKYAMATAGECESCPLLHSPSSDQSECELEPMNILLWGGGVLVFLFVCLGHRLIGCPPFWLLMLDRCFCPRRILAERLCPKYYFLCECKHPDHNHSPKSFSAVSPGEEKGVAHGWVFCCKLQPGIKDVARCKFCTLHHEEWCVNQVLVEEQRLEDKLHSHVNLQLDMHAKDTRHQIDATESQNLEERRRQENTFTTCMSELEASAAKHQAMNEASEEQLQSHVKDVQKRWKTQRAENKDAQQRYAALEDTVSRGQGKLQEEVQAQVKEVHQEFETYLFDNKGSLSDKTQIELNMKALKKTETQRLQDVDTFESALSKQIEKHDALDSQLRTSLSQVLGNFESQQEKNNAVQAQLARREAFASELLGKHESLELQVQEYKLQSSSEFGAQRTESTANYQNSKTALQAQASQQNDVHEALVEKLQTHMQDTQARFQTLHSESTDGHNWQLSALESSEMKQFEAHEALQAALEAHEERTQRDFADHHTEAINLHDHQTAALQASEEKQLNMHEELVERFGVHAAEALTEFQAQQAENQTVQRQHADMQVKESRQFGRHEHLAADVKALRGQLKIVHEKFEGQHSEHREATEVLQRSVKTEHEQTLASAAASTAAFEQFKGLTAEQIRKHDMALQRLYNELGSASDQIGKQQIGLQRAYAELGIPQNTMPTSWGSSLAASPAPSPDRLGAVSRSSMSP